MNYESIFEEFDEITYYDLDDCGGEYIYALSINKVREVVKAFLEDNDLELTQDNIDSIDLEELKDFAYDYFYSRARDQFEEENEEEDCDVYF